MQNQTTATPNEMRQLLFVKDRLMGAKDAFESQEEWLAEIGRAEAMYRGAIPFDPQIIGSYQNVHPVQFETGVQKSKLMAVDFFGPKSKATAIKNCLKASFENVHNCNAMSKPQTGREHIQSQFFKKPGTARFKIWLTTAEAANLVFKNNPELFDHIDVYHYGSREDLGSVAAPIILPPSKAQLDEMEEMMAEDMANQTDEDIFVQDDDEETKEEQDPEIEAAFSPLGETVEKDVDMEFDIDTDF